MRRLKLIKGCKCRTEEEEEEEEEEESSGEEGVAGASTRNGLNSFGNETRWAEIFPRQTQPTAR
jgi:hypothetical protein